MPSSGHRVPTLGAMTAVDVADDDFRVHELSVAALVGLQHDAECRGFSTRWSSEAALRGQVADGPVVVMTLLREVRHGTLRAYRCLVLFQSLHTQTGKAVTTLDIAPEQLAGWPSNPDAEHFRSTFDQHPTVSKA